MATASLPSHANCAGLRPWLAARGAGGKGGDTSGASEPRKGRGAGFQALEEKQPCKCWRAAAASKSNGKPPKIRASAEIIFQPKQEPRLQRGSPCARLKAAGERGARAGVAKRILAAPQHTANAHTHALFLPVGSPLALNSPPPPRTPNIRNKTPTRSEATYRPPFSPRSSCPKPAPPPAKRIPPPSPPPPPPPRRQAYRWWFWSQYSP